MFFKQNKSHAIIKCDLRLPLLKKFRFLQVLITDVQRIYRRLSCSKSVMIPEFLWKEYLAYSLRNRNTLKTDLEFFRILKTDSLFVEFRVTDNNIHVF